VRDFNLGILGGCLTHQPGIPKSELYHRKVARRLADAGRARLLVHIARDFEQEHCVRLEALRREYTLDAVLVHVRSAFIRKAPLITTQVASSGVRYFLHPFLFRPWQSGWAKVENAQFADCRQLYHRKHPTQSTPIASALTPATETNPAEIVPGATRVAGIALRDLFFLGGALAGTEAWAIRDELRMLRELRTRCEELRLPLLVMGPSRRPDNFWLDRLCKRLDSRLQSQLGQWSLPYCNLPDANNANGTRLYYPDGFHFTSAGHDYTAERLATLLEAWLDLAASPSEKLPAPDESSGKLKTR